MNSGAAERDRDKEWDRDRDVERRSLPSFAQAFPSNDSQSSFKTTISKDPEDKLPSIHSISRPHLRSALSDLGPSSAEPSSDLRKRAREDHNPSIPASIKDEDDMEEDVKPDPDALSSAVPPQKKRRTTISSDAGPQMDRSQSHAPSIPSTHTKHSLSSHSAAIQANNASSISPSPDLPSTQGFARRRNMLSSRKAAPSGLVINPPAQSHTQNKALQPTIQSAPPVPASRFRLHQVVNPSSGGHAGPSPAIGPLPSISRSQKRGTTGTSGMRLTNPPKTAGLMTSTPINPANVAGPGGLRTTLLPPTPTPTSSGFTHQVHPPVPPTPSSLRHTLNQPLVSPGARLSHSTISVHGSGGSVALTPKQAFLNPFEAFYDSLSDSRQLKSWLQDQLTRSNALLESLQRVEEKIAAEVEKRIRPVKEECEWLRGRVGELEELVGTKTSAEQAGKGLNGGLAVQRSPDIGSIRRSAERERERDRISNTPSPSLTHSSPGPAFSRMTTSSTRLDPPPPPQPANNIERRPRVPSPLGRVNGKAANSRSPTENEAGRAKLDPS